MTALSHRHKSVWHPFAQALLLCALAVVFALAAKVSWYHTQQPASSNIASMKACKAAAVAADTIAAPAVTALLPWVLCVVALLLGDVAGPLVDALECNPLQSAPRHVWTARPPPAL